MHFELYASQIPNGEHTKVEQGCKTEWTNYVKVIDFFENNFRQSIDDLEK